MISATYFQDIAELVIPGAPSPDRCLLKFVPHGGWTLKRHEFGLVRRSKKIKTVAAVTGVKRHDCLLGGELRRLRAFEILLQ
jgi:hypothetical protein